MDRDKYRSLTNEHFLKRFKSQFDIVNYAIKRAQDMVLSGREPMAASDTQNAAYQVLAEISLGRDSFDLFDSFNLEDEDDDEDEIEDKEE
jgi:DNA-directed RNA polymerase subunit omega